MPDAAFTFRLMRTSWKSRTLVYEEPEYLLSIYLELSGVREYDLVGNLAELEQWTAPAGEPISAEKRREIMDRLADWSRFQRLRIHLGPSIDMQEEYARYTKKGWSVVHNPDGSTTVSPPKRKSWFQGW